MSEVWKNIEGYDKYMVSSKGRIWSKTRVVSTSNKNIKTIRKGKFLKTRTNDGGYEIVNLSTNESNKKYRTVKVHRLIAKAFIPNPNNLRTVNHLDFNRLNNNVNNLEWASHSENNAHGWKGKNREVSREMARETCKLNGKKNRRITLETKLKIIKEYKEGNITQKDLGAKYNVSSAVVSNVVNKKYFTAEDYDTMDKFN